MIFLWFVYDFAMVRTISARPALQNMVIIMNFHWFGAKLLYKIEKNTREFSILMDQTLQNL